MLILFQWIFRDDRVVSKQSLKPPVKPKCLEDLIRIASIVTIQVLAGGGFLSIFILGLFLFLFLALRIIIFTFLIATRLQD